MNTVCFQTIKYIIQTPNLKLNYNMKNSIFFLVVLMVTVSSCQGQEKSEKLQKPNIIWLMAEDISLDLECYGVKGVKTPALNKMVQEGVIFTNAFCTNSICSPSRSAMMTGVHQLKINAQHHRSNRDVALPEPYKPFTYWLREAGYTCILGHHGVMKKGRKIDVNFKFEQTGPWDGKNKFGIFDKLDTFEVADQPFFAQIQLVATHRGDWWDKVREESTHPVNPDSVELPPYFADDSLVRLDWAKYLDQMEYIDNEVAMIFAELEEKGVAENTVVIFIGDNGRCNVLGKGYLHDPGIRIPLIVKWPRGLSEGQVRADVVSTTDITATILDIAGAEMPEYLTGKSFLKNDFKRDEVYASRDLWDEIMEKSRCVTNGKWKYIRNDKPEIPYDAHQAYLEFYRPAVHLMRALNAENKLNKAQAFFFQKNKPQEELYNLVNDPFELINLAEDPSCKFILDSMRIITQKYDREMEPVSNIFHPVHPEAVDVLNWIKNEKPALYKKMRNGVEIGFSALAREYSQKKSK